MYDAILEFIGDVTYILSPLLLWVHVYLASNVIYIVLISFLAIANSIPLYCYFFFNKQYLKLKKKKKMSAWPPLVASSLGRSTGCSKMAATKRHLRHQFRRVAISGETPAVTSHMVSNVVAKPQFSFLISITIISHILKHREVSKLSNTHLLMV